MKVTASLDGSRVILDGVDYILTRQEAYELMVRLEVLVPKLAGTFAPVMIEMDEPPQPTGETQL